MLKGCLCLYFMCVSSFLTVDQFIFISGPVVISPLNKILFKTIFSKEDHNPNTHWFKIQNNISTEICFGVDGFSKLTSVGKEVTEWLEIPYTKENLGVYQLCVKDRKSNTIAVSQEGMF